MGEWLQFVSSLRWPLAVIIIAVMFMIAYRRQIAGCIDRIKKIKAPKFEAEMGPTSAYGKIETPISEQFVHLFSEELIADREDRLRVQLRDIFSLDIASREQKILKFFAAVLLGFYFEKTYLLIYGSQVRALQSLNSHIQGVPLEEIAGYYDEAKSQYPIVYGDYDFGKWLSFLQSNSLLRSDDSRAFITVEGKEFLKYLIEMKYGLEKIG